MDDIEIPVVDVPVVEVTVQEDRALVRREGTVSLPPGRTRVRIEGVAPVLVDKSLVAELVDPAGDDDDSPAVLGVSAQRSRVTEQRQRPEAHAELRDQLFRRRAELHEQRTRLAETETEHETVGALLGTTLAELAENASWGTPPSADDHAVLDRLEQRVLELGAQRCAELAEIQRQEQQLADLQQLAQATDSVAAHATATLEVELRNPGDAERAVRLRVDYLVPGALWRPWHRARLHEGEAPEVELQCEGCVWQATGEDWTDVQLWFSTERPSLGLTPPPLHTDRLATRKKGSAVEVQTRQQEIHTAGLGAADEGAPPPAEELPGIDDGGEAQRLRGRGRSTIPGDGRPYRVPLFELRGPAELSLRCVPELAPAVLLRSEQANAAAHPLLAGPVDLMRHSGLVGRTSILYVAPGERFELGWGPDNALRVTRELEPLEWERKTLSAWTRKPRRVRIKLSNLEAAPRSIEVRERIAVSEIDKVKVELVSTEPSTSVDADGFLRWDIRLRGLEHHTLKVEWALVVHDDVKGV